MSTRCVINFSDGVDVRAKIYRHNNGYPNGNEGVLGDLTQFFKEVKSQTTDTRFTDASYLAAKYVVWLSAYSAGRYLDFLGVGVVQENPCDIEFEYTVMCVEVDDDNEYPRVMVREV